jgi:hypothetical protein
MPLVAVNLLLEGFFMLQYEFQQLGHGGLVFRLPDGLVAVPGDKQSFAVVTLRGVAIVNRVPDVGALQVSRRLALQHGRRVMNYNN